MLDPPGIPEITGKSLVAAGNEQKLTCVTKAGNPPAKLNWYRGSAVMESHYTLEGDMVKAEVISLIRACGSCPVLQIVNKQLTFFQNV